jgi:hypothetical protein
VGAEVWERQGCVRREGAPTSACASPLPSNYNQCATTGLGMGPERAADEMGRAGAGERRPSAGKRLRGERREAAAPSPLLVLAGGGGPSCTHWRSCSPSRMGATEGEEEAHPVPDCPCLPSRMGATKGEVEAPSPGFTKPLQ